MNIKDLEFFGLENDSMESILSKVSFFVEGSSSDKYRLLKEIEKGNSGYSTILHHVIYNFGHGIEVGTIKSNDKDYPVIVSFNYCRIGDSLVAFYECDSRCCDWVMIEEYLKDKYPIKYNNGTRNAMTDVNNFHNCYSHCIESYNSPYEKDINLELNTRFPEIDIEVKSGNIIIKNENLFGWRRKWVKDITIDRCSTKTPIEVADEISLKINSEYLPRLERFKEFKNNIDNSKTFIDIDELLDFALDIEASNGKKNLLDFSDGFKKCLKYIL